MSRDRFTRHARRRVASRSPCTANPRADPEAHAQADAEAHAQADRQAPTPAADSHAATRPTPSRRPGPPRAPTPAPRPRRDADETPPPAAGADTAPGSADASPSATPVDADPARPQAQRRATRHRRRPGRRPDGAGGADRPAAPASGPAARSPAAAMVAPSALSRRRWTPSNGAPPDAAARTRRDAGDDVRRGRRALAFGVFGKRRRDGEQPDTDDVLAACRGQRAGRRGRHPVRASLATPAPAADVAACCRIRSIGEIAMPRWRRPSLLEARKADPIRGRHRRAAPDLRPRARRPARRPRAAPHPLQPRPPPRQPRRAARHGARLPRPGRRGPAAREARRVLARPVPRRAPGLDPQDDARRGRRRAAASRARPTATMPIAAETWTMGDDVDGDVLAAYLESRRRSLTLPGSRRSTRMCWWAMFGTKTRG